MHKGKILGLALAMALSGCASFTKDEVAPVTLPSMASYASKPNVYVDFDYYEGLPSNPSAIEVPQVRDVYKTQLEKTITDSGLFGRVTFDEFQKQPGDYGLRLKVHHHPLPGGQMVWAFFSGFTFGVMPAMGTDRFTMTLETLDANGQKLTDASNQDAVNTWIGLVFIPMMGNTPDEAARDTFNRQVNALLKRMVESKTLQYSALSAYEPRA